MLLNPFTPSDIVWEPEDFFGRVQELRLTERSLLQGSVAIRGGVGIGKSSLLSRIRLHMEGFDSSHKSKSVVAVGDKDIKTVDDAARLLLETFVDFDERSKKFNVRLGPVLTIESSEVCKYFATGRHLAALKRILEEEYFQRIFTDADYLFLAIDEADKCPVPIARLIRSINTHVQQIGVKKIRFILAGVSPYFQTMVNEDQGISRFFYKVINLGPMSEEEATELMDAKLKKLRDDAEQKKLPLNIDPSVVKRVLILSGGHPHILQLMGSHLVEHENDNPDGIIDSNDLVNSLRAICYEDRAHAYESIVHMLELHNKLDTLKELLNNAMPALPTRINRKEAIQIAGKESMMWFIDHNILTVISKDIYGLTDEFLRIRLIMDELEEEAFTFESRLIKQEWVWGGVDKRFPVDDEYPEYIQLPPIFYGDDEEEDEYDEESLP